MELLIGMVLLLWIGCPVVFWLVWRGLSRLLGE